MAVDPILEILIAARINLLLNHSWFGSLATRLVLVDATKWCKAAATDGYHLFYNREFIKSLQPEHVIFLIGHEILHAVLEHVIRGRGLDPEYANMAADYVVNAILVKDRIGKMPDVGLYDEKYADMSFEEVYEHLVKTHAVWLFVSRTVATTAGADAKAFGNVTVVPVLVTLFTPLQINMLPICI